MTCLVDLGLGNRILITGGAGFLGSHLCERLINDGHEVICVDNLFTGSKDNIRDLMDHSHFEFIRHDIISPIDIECDQIYNLACPASPIHYQFNPIRTVQANVIGTMNMLELARRTRARILQASTSEVYGDPEMHPQSEDYWGNVNPIGPRSCYDEGKRVAETLMMDYHRQHNVDVKIARIFNTYGPQMAIDDGRVVSNFITQALAGDDLTIYGGGIQTRSFCYVDDMVDGLVRLMNLDIFTGPINLGNSNEITIRGLADTVIYLTNSISEIVTRPLPQDDPIRRKPDVSLAKKYLEWKSEVELADGLEHTIAYFKGEYSVKSHSR